MSIKGNPAEKLYEILINVKKNSTEGIRRSAKDAWALTFDIDENDEEKIFLAVGKVIQQIETLKEISNRMNSIQKDDFVQDITNLERAIVNTNLDENSRQLDVAISEKRMMALKAISMGLDICNQYSTIEDEEIQGIKEKIIKLINEIKDLSIEDDLKRVIIVSLDNVNIMIENHMLYGIDEVRGAAEKGFGSILLNKELSEAVKSDKKAWETVKKVLNLFGEINTAFTFSKNITPMLTKAAAEIAKNFFTN